MSMVLAEQKAKESSISIQVIRKNGDVEDHGVVSYWHRNPMKRWAWRLRRWLGYKA